MIDLMNLDRRSMIARALALAGASAASGFSFPALAERAEGTGPYLDADTFMLLSSIADTIIPRTDTAGAVDAKVPASFDGLLTNWAAPDRREQLVGAMHDLDGIAKKARGKHFAKLDAKTRHDLLAAHEEEALKIDPTKQEVGLKEMMGGPAYANPGYGRFKDLIVVLYYLSEPALTQELTYVHTPGEWKPSIPVTPETRPSGGSLF